MKIVLENREDIEKFVRNELLTTPDAMEILGVNRSRMSQMIDEGKLTPIRKLPKISLFLRSDIERKKKELEQLRKKYRPYDY